MGEAAAAAAGVPGEAVAAAALWEVEEEEGQASRAAAREGEACGAAAALGGRSLTGEAAVASATFEGEAGGGCGGTASEERTTSPPQPHSVARRLQISDIHWTCLAENGPDKPEHAQNTEWPG